MRASDYMYWVLIKKWAATRWLDEVADGSVTTGDFRWSVLKLVFYYYYYFLFMCNNKKMSGDLKGNEMVDLGLVGQPFATEFGKRLVGRDRRRGNKKVGGWMMWFVRKRRGGDVFVSADFDLVVGGGRSSPLLYETNNAEF